MFYLRYVISELRRRRGRTVLTALGLGVGVGVVVTVTALSSGLDEAQSEVLEPLTGVGTDMTVSRPVAFEGGDAQIGGPGGLSQSDQRALEREGGGPPELDFAELGDPGESFSTDQYITTDLSFPSSEVGKIAETDGVEAVSSALTLQLITIEGTIPEASEQGTFGGPPPIGGAPDQGGGGGFGFDPLTVTGIDASQTDLGLVKADQVTDGRFLRDNETNEALLTQTYADEEGIAVGDRVSVGERKLDVVGLVKAPLGGEASDVYMQREALQKLADREGRVNALEVRAGDIDSVETVAERIEKQFSGSQVTTAQDLTERVSGSLVSAQNLSDKLGTALAIVALAAAFMTAGFLTLSSVNKRTRELGTLKALGWRQWRVVRQISGESVVQGLLGGAFGAVIGVGGAALVGAIGITLEASAETAASGPFGGGPPGLPGTETAATEASTVVLGAPVDAQLLLLAIALAVVGGLFAGAIGGVRAARLRPAEALRSVE